MATMIEAYFAGVLARGYFEHGHMADGRAVQNAARMNGLYEHPAYHLGFSRVDRLGSSRTSGA